MTQSAWLAESNAELRKSKSSSGSDFATALRSVRLSATAQKLYRITSDLRTRPSCNSTGMVVKCFFTSSASIPDLMRWIRAMNPAPFCFSIIQGAIDVDAIFFLFSDSLAGTVGGKGSFQKAAYLAKRQAAIADHAGGSVAVGMFNPFVFHCP